jgi:hypothetical protein
MATPARVQPLADRLDQQRRACERAGSPLYARLIEAIAPDVVAGGPCAAILVPREADPPGSALPLRFLGAIHRLVIDGRAPALAVHYPSVGGSPGPTLVDDFLATVAAHHDEIEAGIERHVQTHEVGRAAALVGGFAEVARRSGLPLRVLEVGASGGLNLGWDRFWYDTGRSTLGDPRSPVRFVGVWQGDALPDLDVGARVVDRAGCDRSPIDVTSDEGRRTLLSFVWPDQVDRLERLDAALTLAGPAAAAVERADVGDWLERKLTEPGRGSPSVATVVFHSIVWQYIGRESRDRMRAALRRVGAEATAASPLAWLRLEPSGPVADLRLTWWPGGEEEVLATSEYHGVPVYWGTRGVRP